MSTHTSEPLVSIVTPVYNNEDYLAECIESVLAQTYQNWEYTIVNNCSTDGSAGIARRYAARDSRIRVVDNEQFLRVVPNHNWALRQISPESKYCKMVFADDWIFPECLERMVAVAEQHPSIGIVGAYVLEGSAVSCVGLRYPSSFVDGREVCRDHLLKSVYVFGSPNSLLYRSDLVRNNDPFFNEGNIHADTEVCFSLLRKCDFGFVHQVLTFTRVRDGSMTSTASDLGASLAGRLQILLGYGPDFLAPHQQETLLADHLSTYYESLGRSLLLGQKRFLEYHKAKLRASGVGFSYMRVLGGALATLWRLGANPGRSITNVFNNSSSKSSAPAPQNSESVVPPTVPAKETRG
ncbi:MAG TPA: glycosyltransferase [Terriglobales bacterium]|nr:glycosyltransferase [Terriglobales bacterium]